MVCWLAGGGLEPGWLAGGSPPAECSPFLAVEHSSPVGERREGRSRRPTGRRQEWHTDHEGTDDRWLEVDWQLTCWRCWSGQFEFCLSPPPAATPAAAAAQWRSSCRLAHRLSHPVRPSVVMSDKEAIRRTSLVAGQSRRDRFGHQRPRHRETTLRAAAVNRRESEGLPFEQEEDDGQQQQDDVDAEDHDDDGDASMADDNTTAAATATPRTRRSAAPRSGRSPARSPSASSPVAAAAAAAAASPRSSRSAVKSSPAAAAASISPPSPRSAARTPRGARSPAESGGKRKATSRTWDSRPSVGFSPPFSKSQAGSRAPSMAPERDADDSMQDGEEAEPTQNGDYAEFDFQGGGGGGDDGDDEENEPAASASPASARRSSKSPAKGSPARSNEEEAAAAAAAPSGAAAPAASKSKGVKRSAPAAARPVASGGGRVGRKTMHIISNARDVGLGTVDEEHTDVGSNDEGTPRKRQRPTRAKLAPIEWWQTREVNYERTVDGPGAILPVPNRQQPVRQLASSPELKPRAKRPKSNKPKQHAAHPIDGLRAAGEKRDGELTPAEEAQMAKLPSYIRILDPEGNEQNVQCLAKVNKQIPLEALGAPSAGGHPMPHGGKAFEQPEFSSGVLSLPPRAKKQREVANNNEIFNILSGPVNGLTLTLHGQPMQLSPGMQFMMSDDTQTTRTRESGQRGPGLECPRLLFRPGSLIRFVLVSVPSPSVCTFSPAGNTYELHNTSTRDSIRLMFVLVKPAAVWMLEAREQVEQERQMQMDEEDEEEEEEEEERAPAHRSNKNKRK